MIGPIEHIKGLDPLKLLINFNEYDYQFTEFVNKACEIIIKYDLLSNIDDNKRTHLNNIADEYGSVIVKIMNSTSSCKDIITKLITDYIAIYDKLGIIPECFVKVLKVPHDNEAINMYKNPKFIEYIAQKYTKFNIIYHLDLIEKYIEEFKKIQNMKLINNSIISMFLALRTLKHDLHNVDEITIPISLVETIEQMPDFNMFLEQNN
jgi:hypothetical protein